MEKESSLASVYASHHKERRGDFFVLEADERKPFLNKAVGKGKKVLDIGCRDGALTSSFMDGNSVLGVDIDPDAIKRAKDKYNFNVIQADLNGPWNFNNDVYDVVVAAEIIEHVYYPDRIVGEAAKKLAKDGMLVGTIPHAFPLQHRLRYLFGTKKNTPLSDPTHINQFTYKELVTILSKHFNNVEIDFIISKKFKVLTWLIPKYLFAYGFMFKAWNKK